MPPEINSDASPLGGESARDWVPGRAVLVDAVEPDNGLIAAAVVVDDLDTIARRRAGHSCHRSPRGRSRATLLLDELLQLLRRLDELVDEVEHDVPNRAHLVHAPDDLA